MATRKTFFGLEGLQETIDKFKRVVNLRAFWFLVEDKLRDHGAYHAAALVKEREDIIKAVTQALQEFPE